MSDNEQPSTSCQAHYDSERMNQEAAAANAIPLQAIPWDSDNDEETLLRCLRQIIRCSQCSNVSDNNTYQCMLGHLFCSTCYQQVENGTNVCPVCFSPFARDKAFRNLFVEKAVSEMQSSCKFCGLTMRAKLLNDHELNECQKRLVVCKYQQIGCPWEGEFGLLSSHQECCAMKNKTGAEIMTALEPQSEQLENSRNYFNSLTDILTYEMLVFTDVTISPVGSNAPVTSVLFGPQSFRALNEDWILNVAMENLGKESEESPLILYQLTLTSYIVEPFTLKFFLKPLGRNDLPVETVIQEHLFKVDSKETGDKEIKILKRVDVIEILCDPLKVRLFMFAPGLQRTIDV